MRDSNSFSNYYKSVGNAELLAILENPADYQPEALEAAQSEWNQRQLSLNDIDEARRLLALSQQNQSKQNEKIRAVEQRTKEKLISIVDKFNPVREGIS